MMSARWLAYPIEAIATFLIVFGTRLNILCTIKVRKNLCSLNAHIVTIKVRIVIVFGARGLMSFKHMCFKQMFLELHQPHTTHL
jgi:hypothetical protein